MSLGEKSDAEISELLTEYGIKHGPIVESTRGLYERKLEKAMASAAVKPSSDKTYYREEEEEVTYITYHSPVRQDPLGDMLRRRGNADTEEEEEEDGGEEEEEEEEEQETEEIPVQVTHRTVNHSAVRSKQPAKKSGGCMSKFFRLLLLLAVLAAAYYAYSQMVNSEEQPTGVQ
ncbi:emerin (Emery-Dreifuss muscular dystrophy) [Halichoeres trimaculatus]|uniref:emerin (Emery-Dreifuss muscular dystrophy) n=1 Tax=Halichoeres trimaculatus TaxID=147232 RepID=UPI003D9F0A02